MAVLETIKDNFPINRVVALLSPILVALGASVGTWLVNHLPLVADQINGDQISAVFIALATAGIAMAYKWLDNWGKHERASIPVPPAVQPAPVEVGSAPPAGQ